MRKKSACFGKEALASGKDLTLRVNEAAKFAIGYPDASAVVGTISLPAKEVDSAFSGSLVIWTLPRWVDSVKRLAHS
jgi:hypothetical protein